MNKKHQTLETDALRRSRIHDSRLTIHLQHPTLETDALLRSRTHASRFTIHVMNRKYPISETDALRRSRIHDSRLTIHVQHPALEADALLRSRTHNLPAGALLTHRQAGSQLALLRDPSRMLILAPAGAATHNSQSTIHAS